MRRRSQTTVETQVSARAAPKPRTVERMWAEYLITRAVEVRNELIVHYSPLIQTHAARLSRKLPDQVSYEEICSAAFDGLIDAVEAYDPQRKAKFETFCQQRISGAVMDWLRSLDPQSRTVRTFERRRQQAQESMYDNYLTAGPDRVATRMGMSPDRFDYLSRLSQLGKEVHFSAMDASDDQRHSGSAHRWDVRDDAADDPAKQALRTMLTEEITRGLAREERLVLILYYFEQMTMAEIGSVLDLSESRVSQIHKDILARLRAKFVGRQGDLAEALV